MRAGDQTTSRKIEVCLFFPLIGRLVGAEFFIQGKFDAAQTIPSSRILASLV
jgi:hypothetical protein